MSTDPGWSAVAARRGLVLDAAVPNVARIWNLLLGGRDHYEPDREFAQALLEVMPEAEDLALQGRAFVARVVRWLAEEHGVDQFIDLGVGLPVPSGDDVAEIAQRVHPGARVLCADRDDLVVAFGRALLERPNVIVTAGDLRTPGTILYGADLRGLIDVPRPVAVLMCSVLDQVAAEEDPAGVVTVVGEWLPPGGFLVLTHLCSDRVDPDRLKRVERLYDSASAPLIARGGAEIAGWLGGLQLLEPGLVDVARWRRFMPQFPQVRRTPGVRRAPSRAGPACLVGGVARKPWPVRAWGRRRGGASSQHEGHKQP